MKTYKQRYEQFKRRYKQLKRRFQQRDELIGKRLVERRCQLEAAKQQNEQHLRQFKEAKEKIEHFLIPLLDDLLNFERRQPRRKKWRGDLGVELVDAVAKAKADGAKTTADAIRKLRKSATWRGHKQRTLEIRYQDAKKFCQPYDEVFRVVDAEMKKMPTR